LQYQNPVQSSSPSLKKRKGNISDILNQKKEKNPYEKNQLTLILKFRLKFKTISKKKKKMLITFPNQKKRNFTKKSNPPTYLYNIMKFKFILKKKKREDISNVSNQKKERNSHKKINSP
jgi:hypothetical protein